jgi:hypothetical protein
MELALGQYLLYKAMLRRSAPDRRLVLALPTPSILAFDPEQEEIRKWLP